MDLFITLPEQVNHEGIRYHSPLQEATLANIANQKNTNDQEINFLDLKAILSSEMLDIEDQEKKYLQDVAPSENEAYKALFTKQKDHLRYLIDDCLGVFLAPEQNAQEIQRRFIQDLREYIKRNKTRW